MMKSDDKKKDKENENSMLYLPIHDALLSGCPSNVLKIILDKSVLLNIIKETLEHRIEPFRFNSLMILAGSPKIDLDAIKLFLEYCEKYCNMHALIRSSPYSTSFLHGACQATSSDSQFHQFLLLANKYAEPHSNLMNRKDYNTQNCLGIIVASSTSAIPTIDYMKRPRQRRRTPSDTLVFLILAFAFYPSSVNLDRALRLGSQNSSGTSVMEMVEEEMKKSSSDGSNNNNNKNKNHSSPSFSRLEDFYKELLVVENKKTGGKNGITSCWRKSVLFYRERYGVNFANDGRMKHHIIDSMRDCCECVLQ